MGLAILWVIYYHLPHDFITNPLFLKLQLFGYAGVDIFVYASEIGCYYSLSKNSETLPFSIFYVPRNRIQLVYRLFTYIVSYCTDSFRINRMRRKVLETACDCTTKHSIHYALDRKQINADIGLKIATIYHWCDKWKSRK